MFFKKKKPDINCSLLLSVEESGDLSINFVVGPGRDEQFVSLLCDLYLGKLRHIINQYILDFATQQGYEQDAQEIIRKLDRKLASESYNAFGLDEEDALVSPMSVFRGQNE